MQARPNAVASVRGSLIRRRSPRDLCRTLTVFATISSSAQTDFRKAACILGTPGTPQSYSAVQGLTGGPNTPSRKPGSAGPPAAPTAGISIMRSSANPSPFESMVPVETSGWPFGTNSCG